jgi:short-subunit dehydrogenase
VIQLDVAVANSFDDFVNTLSTLQNEFQSETIDAIVNNAGVGSYTSFFDTSMEQFDAMVNITPKGTLLFLSKSYYQNFKIVEVLLSSSGLCTYNGYAPYAIIGNQQSTR